MCVLCVGVVVVGCSLSLLVVAACCCRRVLCADVCCCSVCVVCCMLSLGLFVVRLCWLLVVVVCGCAALTFVVW